MIHLSHYFSEALLYSTYELLLDNKVSRQGCNISSHVLQIGVAKRLNLRTHHGIITSVLGVSVTYFVGL